MVQEEPYQGGDEDHGQRDQQQIRDVPGPNSQPGLGNIKQVRVMGGWAEFSCFNRDKIKALKTLDPVWVGDREKHFRGQ